VLLDLGFLWSSRDLERAGDYFKQAMLLARRADEPAILARSLNRLGNWYFNTDKPLDAAQCHREALALFEEAHDRRGVAETLDLLGMVTVHCGLEAESGAYFERAIAAFEDVGDRRGLSSVLSMAAQMQFGSDGHPSLPAARADRATQLAREIGWLAGESFALSSLALCRTVLGDLSGALDAARHALAIAQDIDHHVWTIQAHAVLGLAFTELLVMPLARDHIEKAAELASDSGGSYWVRAMAVPLARVRLWQGEAGLAAQVLDNAFGAETGSDAASLSEYGCRWLRAELALSAGDPAGALDITSSLLNSGKRIPGSSMFYDVWRVHAEALAAVGRVGDAEAVLIAERDLATRKGALTQLWHIYQALGQFYARYGSREDADRAFSEARTVIGEIAANLPDEPLPEQVQLAGSPEPAIAALTVRAAFLHNTAALLPRPKRSRSPRPRSSRRAAKEAFGGLTERERDVVILIARGKSNRQIADTLVIGQRTVQTHIASIFTKLGCESRTQVASWAVANCMLTDIGD
jgi:DNA-binding CsgD family transcriptional regulator